MGINRRLDLAPLGLVCGIPSAWRSPTTRRRRGSPRRKRTRALHGSAPGLSCGSPWGRSAGRHILPTQPGRSMSVLAIPEACLPGEGAASKSTTSLRESLRDQTKLEVQPTGRRDAAPTLITLTASAETPITRSIQDRLLTISAELLPASSVALLIAWPAGILVMWSYSEACAHGLCTSAARSPDPRL